MLRIDPVDTIQKPIETTFKNRVTSEKLAAQKLLRLADSGIKQDALSTLLPKNINVTEAANYLSNEAAKVTSSKLAEQKMARLTEIL